MKLRTLINSPARSEIIKYLKNIYIIIEELYIERCNFFNRYHYTVNQKWMEERERKAWLKFYNYLEKNILLYGGKIPEAERCGVFQVDDSYDKDFIQYLMARLQVIRKNSNGLIQLMNSGHFYAKEFDRLYKIWGKYFFEICMSVERYGDSWNGPLFNLSDEQVKDYIDKWKKKAA